MANYLSKNHFKDRLSYLTNQEKCLECALQKLDPIYTYFPKPTSIITPNRHKLDSISSQNIVVQGVVDRAIQVRTTTKAISLLQHSVFMYSTKNQLPTITPNVNST